MGLSSSRARASDASPHGGQSTGVSLCWRREGDGSSASLFVTPPRLPGPQLGTLDLAARRLRQPIREVDHARVLVGSGLGLRVLLELAAQLLARRVALTQHDDRAHDLAALLVRGSDGGGL